VLILENQEIVRILWLKNIGSMLLLLN